MLVHTRSRARMLLVGGTFVLISGLIYFVFMAAWLNVFLLFGHLAWVTAAAVLLGPSSLFVVPAVLGGAVGLGSWAVDYFLRRDHHASEYLRKLHRALSDQHQEPAGSWPRFVRALVHCATDRSTAASYLPTSISSSLILRVSVFLPQPSKRAAS